MNKEEIINVLNKIMEGDDWTLVEMEKGVILLQRRSNKVKGSFTNLKSR